MSDAEGVRGEADGADIVAAQAGDAGAFARLISRHERVLNIHLARFTRDLTVLDDLRQETYLEAFISLSGYRHHAAFSGWLRRIASRAGYRHWARLIKENRIKVAWVELRRNGASATSEPFDREEFQLLEDILARLDSSDRLLMEMRFIKGLRATEIAQQLGWKESRVRVRLHRVLKGLRSAQGHEPTA
jgi:RNA polymerase sigma-70 factor, ECF subfamily